MLEFKTGLVLDCFISVTLSDKRSKKAANKGMKSNIGLILGFMKLAQDITKMQSLNMMSGVVDATLLSVLS